MREHLLTIIGLNHSLIGMGRIPRQTCRHGSSKVETYRTLKVYQYCQYISIVYQVYQEVYQEPSIPVLSIYQYCQLMVCTKEFPTSDLKIVLNVVELFGQLTLKKHFLDALHKYKFTLMQVLDNAHSKKLDKSENTYWRLIKGKISVEFDTRSMREIRENDSKSRIFVKGKKQMMLLTVYIHVDAE